MDFDQLQENLKAFHQAKAEFSKGKTTIAYGNTLDGEIFTIYRDLDCSISAIVGNEKGHRVAVPGD